MLLCLYTCTRAPPVCSFEKGLFLGLLKTKRDMFELCHCSVSFFKWHFLKVQILTLSLVYLSLFDRFSILGTLTCSKNKFFRYRPKVRVACNCILGSVSCFSTMYFSLMVVFSQIVKQTQHS